MLMLKKEDRTGQRWMDTWLDRESDRDLVGQLKKKYLKNEALNKMR
jgi:hypothetical protein